MTTLSEESDFGMFDFFGVMFLKQMFIKVCDLELNTCSKVKQDGGCLLKLDC